MVVAVWKLTFSEYAGGAGVVGVVSGGVEGGSFGVVGTVVVGGVGFFGAGFFFAFFLGFLQVVDDFFLVVLFFDVAVVVAAAARAPAVRAVVVVFRLVVLRLELFFLVVQRAGFLAFFLGLGLTVDAAADAPPPAPLDTAPLATPAPRPMIITAIAASTRAGMVERARR